MYDHVKFLVYNATDEVWITAKLNSAEGVYYVTGSADKENLATQFSPVNDGRIVIKGLEDDEYMLTEIETADGYTLLTDPRYVTISTDIDYERPCDIYTRDVEQYLKGLVQNDPRYSEDSITVEGWAEKNALTNIPQEHLEHFHLTASATVDGMAAEMLSSDGSDNALAPLEVTNHVMPNIPKTGDTMLLFTGITGAALLVSGICMIIIPFIRKNKHENE